MKYSTAHWVRPVGGLLLLAFFGFKGAVRTRRNGSAEQKIEGLVVVHAYGVLVRVRVLIDVDLLEEALVEKTSVVVICFEVGGMAVAGQIQNFGKICSGPLVVFVGARQLLLDVAEPTSA